MTSAKEGAVFESILPQQKKGDDDSTRLEFREGTSANESAVLETISPQQKRTTTVKTRLEFREGTCNDKRKGGRSFRDHFTPAEKKGDDGITRLEFGEATSAKEGAVLETLFPQPKK